MAAVEIVSLLKSSRDNLLITSAFQEWSVLKLLFLLLSVHAISPSQAELFTE